MNLSTVVENREAKTKFTFQCILALILTIHCIYFHKLRSIKKHLWLNSKLFIFLCLNIRIQKALKIYKPMIDIC